MYTPKLYREEDRKTILEFLKQNNFPALVTHDGERLLATHLPVEVVEAGGEQLSIYSHMSRANPQWKSFGTQEALLIFQGAHTYISPTWYDHVNVPTWNYRMVHVYGTLRIVEGDELKSVLGRLVERHEPTSEYRLESLPHAYVEKELKGTLGFVMDVTRIDAGFKLSQNRSDADHENIIHELEKRGDAQSKDVAQAMKKNR